MKKLILILFVVTQFIFSQNIDRTVKPTPQKTPKLTLPKIERAELKNGLKVLLVEHHELPVVQVQLIIMGGATQEKKSGVANLTANMIDEGTTKRNALLIADDISFLGSSINISSGRDANTASLLTLKENLDASLEIFSDIILNPSFPDFEWDRIKKQHLANLQQQKDLPAVVSSNVFLNRLFGESHPYGQPSGGTVESVNSILIEDLKNYYIENYTSNNASIIIVGDVTMKEVLPKINNYFLNWKGNGKVNFTETNPIKYESTNVFLIDKPSAAQSEINVGHIGVSRNNKDYFKLYVLNTILGGQFSSRINMNLREQKGFTYGARSSFSMNKINGPFTISAPVKTTVTDSSMIEIMKEFRKIVNEDVTVSELMLAKNSIVRGLPQGFETPSQIASQISNIVIYNLKDNYFNTVVEKFNSVSIKDLRETAKKYLKPENNIVVIVGDLNLIKDKIANLNLGKITILNNEGKEIK